jgi:hypothetical protein
MTATTTSTVLTTREALIAEVKANQTDLTAQLVLADCITETTGDYDAAVAEVELIALTAVIDGKGRKSAGYRGEICRQAGATRCDGRPIAQTVICIVAGGMEPEYEGNSWHYETKGGTVIRHPNAYRRIAKSAKLVYCPASHQVTVGADWVRENILA